MSSIVRHRPYGASPPRAFRRLSPSILRAAIRLITFHVSLFTHHFSSHHASRLTLSNAIQHFLTFMNSEPAISQEFPTKTIFHLGLRMSNLPCQTSPENLKKMERVGERRPSEPVTEIENGQRPEPCHFCHTALPALLPDGERPFAFCQRCGTALHSPHNRHLYCPACASDLRMIIVNGQRILSTCPSCGDPLPPWSPPT